MHLVLRPLLWPRSLFSGWPPIHKNLSLQAEPLLIINYTKNKKVCEILLFSLFLWPLTFACDFHRPPRSLSFLSLDIRYMLLCIGSKYKVCRFNRNWDMAIVWIKIKWRHNDVITHSIFMKFEHKTTKGISKQHIEFQFDQT